MERSCWIEDASGYSKLSDLTELQIGSLEGTDTMVSPVLCVVYPGWKTSLEDQDGASDNI